MDVAVIDWKDSKFEKDVLYEDINAPQWIDFSDADTPVDDDAWFCRPGTFFLLQLFVVFRCCSGFNLQCSGINLFLFFFVKYLIYRL